MPLSPEWAKLPKRRCDDCGKTYKPVRPRREGEMGFCSDNCRKSYHKHGGAYRKLRAEVERLVLREVTRRVQLEEPCGLCKGKGVLYSSGNGGRGNAGKSPVSATCPKCINGAVLTSFGLDVIDLIRNRVMLLPNRPSAESLPVPSANR